MTLVLKMLRNVDESVADWLPSRLPIIAAKFALRHRIAVVLSPSPSVRANVIYRDSIEESQSAFGFYSHFPSRRAVWAPPRCSGLIVVAANLRPLAHQICERREIVAETICHELVHYEQWRDGRKPTERGVEQRAKALVRAMVRDMPQFLKRTSVQQTE